MGKLETYKREIGFGIGAIGAISGGGTIVSWIVDAPTWVTIAAAGVLLSGASGWAGWKLHGRSRRGLPHGKHAYRVIRILHRRWFPGEQSKLDEDYRVSLFVPRMSGDSFGQWERLGRSVGEQTECIWPHVTDPHEQKRAGLVVQTAVEGMPQEVMGIPVPQRADAPENDAEKKRYLREACLDEAAHDLRSWPWATIRTYLSRSESGRILCILVVERKSGLPIEVRGRRFQAIVEGNYESQDVSSVEAQLAADVLSAAWEES